MGSPDPAEGADRTGETDRLAEGLCARMTAPGGVSSINARSDGWGRCNIRGATICARGNSSIAKGTVSHHESGIRRCGWGTGRSCGGVGAEVRRPADQYDREATFPAEDFADLFRAGLLGGAIWPRSHGGHGLGPDPGLFTLWMITKGLAKADMALALLEGHFNSQMLLTALGDARQKDRWVREIVERGDIWAGWSGSSQSRIPARPPASAPSSPRPKVAMSSMAPTSSRPAPQRMAAKFDAYSGSVELIRQRATLSRARTNPVRNTTSRGCGDLDSPYPAGPQLHRHRRQGHASCPTRGNCQRTAQGSIRVFPDPRFPGQLSTRNESRESPADGRDGGTVADDGSTATVSSQRSRRGRDDEGLGTGQLRANTRGPRSRRSGHRTPGRPCRRTSSASL